MKLLVQFSERASCYVALHSSDAGELFKTSARHFCRCLRLQCAKGDVFVGWAGDHSLRQACLEISKPFAESLGLKEGEQVEAVAHAAPIASSVMVQPNRIEDWEVVELQAGFIEENLLSQVSVLMPGMIFPVWVHGQLVAKLQLDPADPNTSECFMLGRDTESWPLSRASESERGCPCQLTKKKRYFTCGCLALTRMLLCLLAFFVRRTWTPSLAVCRAASCGLMHHAWRGRLTNPKRSFCG
ncbi:unnamed protein product [Effrenium voratum]|nr:unnamed protein product [Effrenium voratum]